jgi:TRAP-type C4-dicarboxylate transport system permease small subunit
MAHHDRHTLGSPPDPRGAALRPWLERTLGVFAALILFALVAVTCIDVIGRYFLNAPLRGAFEMTEVLVAALVFAALPLTTERREHVEVDLLSAAFPPRMDRIVAAGASFFSAALLATFAWRLATQATRLSQDGAVTNALGIPLAAIGWFAAASCLLSAAIAALYGALPPGDDRPSRAGEDPL